MNDPRCAGATTGAACNAPGLSCTFPNRPNQGDTTFCTCLGPDAGPNLPDSGSQTDGGAETWQCQTGV